MSSRKIIKNIFVNVIKYLNDSIKFWLENQRKENELDSYRIKKLW